MIGKCKRCGKSFDRPYQYSQKQYEAQRFCGQKCMGKAYLGKKFSAEARRNMSIAHKTDISNETLAERKRVRRMVATARLNGSLKVGKCAYNMFECKGRMEGHHHDYKKPLEVKWLCRRHHLQYHHGLLS